MKERLKQLVERVDKVVSLAGRLKTENQDLRAENDKLRSELTEVKKELRVFKLGHADQSEAMRSRLGSVLARLEELESLQE